MNLKINLKDPKYCSKGNSHCPCLTERMIFKLPIELSVHTYTGSGVCFWCLNYKDVVNLKKLGATRPQQCIKENGI